MAEFKPTQSQKTKSVTTAKKGKIMNDSGSKTKDKTPKIKAKKAILTKAFLSDFANSASCF